ncbi:MAG: DPP IV N-terminal domain-containing protein, partial [Bacteroidales bacterium]|nr:DPP IV N-terminal domain-containing protein [Bacteroidales bacterium]
MRRLFSLFILLVCCVSVWAQNETIDLNAYFKGKYMADRVTGLSWRPGTDTYAYIDDDHNIKLVDAAKGKETMWLSSADLAAQGVSNLRSFGWIDANTIYVPRTHTVLASVKGKTTTETLGDVDWDNVIDQSVKNRLFVIKNDEGVFVQTALNGYKPILLCPDTGRNIVFGESVHRSEWGIDEGQYLSPKGNFIAFYRMDESMVEDYPLVNTATPIATV